MKYSCWSVSILGNVNENSQSFDALHTSEGERGKWGGILMDKWASIIPTGIKASLNSAFPSLPFQLTFICALFMVSSFD